jgi:hypothetical protein
LVARKKDAVHSRDRNERDVETEHGKDADTDDEPRVHAAAAIRVVVLVGMIAVVERRLYGSVVP